jgi:hypothetical protein
LALGNQTKKNGASSPKVGSIIKKVQIENAGAEKLTA